MLESVKRLIYPDHIFIYAKKRLNIKVQYKNMSLTLKLANKMFE